MKVEQAIIKQK